MAMHRLSLLLHWRAFFLALALCLGLPLAQAAAYNFPSNLPPGCSAAGSSYTCGSLALSSGDSISISVPKPANIRFTGTLDISNSATINAGGVASDLNLTVNGALTMAYQTVIMGNVTAGSVNTVDNGLVIGGSLTATSGSIQLQDCASIGGAISSGTGSIAVGQFCVVNGGISSTSGSITTGMKSQIKGNLSSAGAINVGQASIISGSVSSSGSTVDLAYQAQVSGSISGAGRVTLGQAAIIGGDVAAGGSNAISLDFQTQVMGNLSTNGAITVSQQAVVSGKITGGTGAINFGYGAKVVGDVSSSSGTIFFEQASIAQACVRSTASASITLGYTAAINSVCCGASCGNACVINNTGGAMPPACLPTPIADYHFDECSFKGSSGEVIDSRGNYPATTVNGTSSSGTAPTLLDRYADLSASTGLRYISPNTAIPIPSAWTISTWMKTPLSTGGSPYHVLAAVNGGGDLFYMDDRNGFLWGTYVPGSIVNGSFKFSTLAAGWHHIGLVGSGGKTSLYVDGVFKETINQQAKGNLAFIGASWDIDASTREGLNTQLDEFMVFNSALSAGNISTIYNNQKAGKNYDGSARAPSNCAPAIGSFVVSSASAASTCSPQTFSVTAKDASGATLSGYTGSINLSTSTGKGDFTIGSGPAPSGTFTPGAANSGKATYTFAAGDAGVVNLRLSHSLAQNLVITVQDSSVAAAVGSSGSIQFRDNAFVWSEDMGNQIFGSNVIVAGRNHDLQVALWKKDAVTGNCAIATDYSGSRNLKLWRTDNGGPWTAPSIISPALSVPAARPGANNLIGLSFSAGVAKLDLASTDIGKFSLKLDDDSLLYAATTISGSLGDLTLRPFAITVTGLTLGGVSNPGGSLFSDPKFGAAGATFSATLGGYRWSASADTTNRGAFDTTASLAQVTAGGLAPSFNSPITLRPVAGSQTPSTGVLGVLSNASTTNPVITGFKGGTVTVNDLKYSEVGSFLLNTTGVLSNFLGTAGLNLNSTVFVGTVQNNRIGRFVPAGFVASKAILSDRLAAVCSPISTFTYLGETFKLGFTLTAQNVQGTTTQNYTGAFAKLNLAAANALNPAGINGTTPFKIGARLSATSSGTWDLGQSSDAQLSATVSRLSTPDGPFPGSSFGIAPVDSDGVGMMSFNLDTDSPPNGNDRAALRSEFAPLTAVPVNLRFGQLRLQNAIGSQNRDLSMRLLAQYWDGSNFVTNTLDSCTSIDSKALNYGNYRKTLSTSDGLSPVKTYKLVNGASSLTLSKPGGGRSGSMDVALSLSTVSDQSCLQSWTPGVAATLAAGLAYLQGPWCAGTYSKDPSARATFGLYRGSDNVMYQRENY